MTEGKRQQKTPVRVTGRERVRLAEHVKKHYEAGHTIRDTAKEFNISYGMVARLLDEAHATIRTRGPRILSEKEN